MILQTPMFSLSRSNNSKSAAGYLITSINVLVFDPAVLDLPGQVLVASATGVASVRSCPNLPPCLADPMPGISRMVPLLAKAKPIRNDSYVPIITYLRRENIVVKM